MSRNIQSLGEITTQVKLIHNWRDDEPQHQIQLSPWGHVAKIAENVIGNGTKMTFDII